MKNIVKNIVLIIFILLLSCVVLTGCNDGNVNNDNSNIEIEEENKNEIVEETAKEIMNALKNKDSEKIIELTDIVSFVTFINSYTSDGIVEFEEKYKENEEEYNKLSASDKEYAIDMIEKHIEAICEELEDSEIRVDNISDAELVENTKNLYSVNVEYRVIIEDDGENIEDVEDTIYLYKKDSEYYFVGFKSSMYLEYKSTVFEKAEKAKKESYKLLAKEAMNLAVANVKVDYYSEAMASMELEEYATLERLNSELLEQGYMLCEKNDAYKEIEDMDKPIPYGEALYLSNTEYGDEVYSFILKYKDGNIQIEENEN